MFHSELAQMLARTRAGMLEGQPENFSIRDVDRDLKALNSDSQSDYLLAFCKQITHAYLELNGISKNDNSGRGEPSWK